MGTYVREAITFGKQHLRHFSNFLLVESVNKELLLRTKPSFFVTNWSKNGVPT